ncbi:hypothetical protein Hanom_Chr14g01330301 [Helianthus anomalus]
MYFYIMHLHLTISIINFQSYFFPAVERMYFYQLHDIILPLVDFYTLWCVATAIVNLLK